jgi:hypothetical protein
MISFIFFNTNELKNALDYLGEINKTIELKNDDLEKLNFSTREDVSHRQDKFEESIKILNLAVECIGEYQEFIISLSSENQTQNN